MTLEDLTLRSAYSSDFPFLCLLRRLTMKSYVELTWGAWSDTDQAERFRGEFHPLNYQIVIHQGKEIGCLSVEDLKDLLFVDFIAILPEYQRRGIGTRIMKNVIAQAEERKIPVCLNVLKVNPARSLYERLGFRVVGGDDHRHHMERLSER